MAIRKKFLLFNPDYSIHHPHPLEKTLLYDSRFLQGFCNFLQPFRKWCPAWFFQSKIAKNTICDSDIIRFCCWQSLSIRLWYLRAIFWCSN